jgi:predicted RNase H-like HicB family nuclease
VRELTTTIEMDGDWYVAWCLEVPGANGQGRTEDEARKSLAGAIELILADRRQDGNGEREPALRTEAVSRPSSERD